MIDNLFVNTNPEIIQVTTEYVTKRVLAQLFPLKIKNPQRP